jgi:hypothetical protein
MTDPSTLGNWIDWPGGPCPVSPNTKVEYRLRNGVVSSMLASDLDWHWGIGTESHFDIVAYWPVDTQADIPLDPTGGWVSEIPSIIPTAPTSFNASGSKYLRPMTCLVDGRADVYAVLEAFEVTCPARQHAIKKLLCAGIRGKGNEAQDLTEARDAVDRAMQMQGARHTAT